MDKCPNCEEELIEEQGIWTCSNCYYEDDYQDLPQHKYKRQREFSNKLAKHLLPKQNIKIRFVKELEEGVSGRTRFRGSTKRPWETSGRYIALPEKLFKKSKFNPNPREKFPKTITHELAHASDKVRSHPDFNPFSTEFWWGCKTCGRSHPGPGHDRIWHEEWDRFEKKRKKSGIK